MSPRFQGQHNKFISEFVPLFPKYSYRRIRVVHRMQRGKPGTPKYGTGFSRVAFLWSTRSLIYCLGILLSDPPFYTGWDYAAAATSKATCNVLDVYERPKFDGFCLETVELGVKSRFGFPQFMFKVVNSKNENLLTTHL